MVATRSKRAATTAPTSSIADTGAPPNKGACRVQRVAGSDPQIAYTLFEPANRVSDLTTVLLHGAAHDERCWHRHWTERLAGQGCRVLTPSYRQHGSSTWSHPVQDATLDDYVADVEAVLAAEGLDPRQVVLVGHSLGGGVAQRFAARHEVAGLVVAASLAFGLWRQALWQSLPLQVARHPVVYTQLLSDPAALFKTPALAREYLFSQDAPDEIVQWYLREVWCHESGQAMRALLLGKPQPLRTRHILFLAGRADSGVPLRLQRHSAAHLHAAFVEVEAPHDLMLTGAWRYAADVVAAFARQCEAATREEVA